MNGVVPADEKRNLQRFHGKCARFERTVRK